MSIIFATSLRPGSETLCQVAGLLAKGLNLPLQLLHVSEDPRAFALLGSEEEHLLGPVRANLYAEAERIAAATGANVQPHLAGGPVVDEIVSLAKWELASMLLLGESPRAILPFLSDLTERVVRKCLVPVLVLRQPERLLNWLQGQAPLRVLVGTDFGLASTQAVRFAAGLQALGPIELKLVHVADPLEAHRHLGLPVPSSSQTLSSEAETLLQDGLNRSLPQDLPAHTQLLIGEGCADQHLTALIQQQDFDLILLGRRHQTLLEQLWNGSVSRGVFRTASVSVASVPPLPWDEGEIRLPRVIVVGTDFSPASDRAIRLALGFSLEDTAVHIVHVLVPQPTLQAREVRDEAWGKLHRLPAVIKGREHQVKLHLLEGDPAEQLLAAVERLGAEVLIISSGSRSSLGRALLGSVAQELSARSHIPVLLVPQPRL